MTEGIMSWKVQLHVVSNNAMRGQQALLLLRRVMGREGGAGYKRLIQYILMSCEKQCNGTRLMLTNVNRQKVD